MKNFITLALSKGRLLNPSILLLKKAGITQRDLKADSRKLLFEDRKNGVRILIIRAKDVPTYVEHGAADMGIAGQDILMEQDPDVYEPLDLQFGACRLVVARPEAKDSDSGWPRAKMRIATKYPRITENYFSRKGIPVEIIRLSGAIELAPAVGLAERVVDLVTTGKTLHENHLVEEQLVAECTAHLIVNRASLKTKMSEVMNLVDRIRKVVEGNFR
jgi:ATP phosphoribosyltransferase